MVMFLVVAGGRLSLAAGVPCALSGEFFLRHNVTADDNDVPGAVI